MVGTVNRYFRRALAALAGQHFDGARDLYTTMGYPRDLTSDQMISVYLRQDIAGRIVDAYPDATWREAPTFTEQAIESAWRAIDEEVHLWRALHRTDRLMGLGHYAVLLVGVDGGDDMSQPLVANGTRRVIYLQPHSERTAQIIQWDSDPTSPRYGRPEMYRITSGVNWTGSGAGQRTLTVHHSRVIHVSERALEDESIGTPRLERVWNRLMDVDKLLGSGAEIYWQNAAMIMQLKADVDVQWDPEEAEALTAQLDEMQNGLRRWFRTRGVDANNIAPGLQGADPSPLVEKQLDIIAGAIGIPKRILVGSEAGELASTQDETNWTSRIQERREQVATPSMIMPLVALLQRIGALPQGKTSVEWPESDTLGEAARADIALKKAQAVATYSNAPAAEGVVTLEEFRAYLGETGPVPTITEDDPLPEPEPLPDEEQTDVPGV